jgi:hypothetical protein
MKKLLPLLFTVMGFTAKAQRIESISVNLYTDSLKKGTFNYINVDGKLSNGKFLPLDQHDLIFWSSDGKFDGNELWIDNDFSKQKVDIKITLKSDPSQHKEFSMYVKQAADPQLKTKDEIMKDLQKNPKRN